MVVAVAVTFVLLRKASRDVARGLTDQRKASRDVARGLTVERKALAERYTIDAAEAQRRGKAAAKTAAGELSSGTATADPSLPATTAPDSLAESPQVPKRLTPGRIRAQAADVFASPFANLVSKVRKSTSSEARQEHGPTSAIDVLAAPRSTTLPEYPPEPRLVIPERVTQAWIETNVPHMSTTTLAYVISELWKRGWTDSEIAQRVSPHVRGSE
jgi:hypothetical protein